MNYQLHYDALIARARNRVIDGYVEIHHVVPRCLGGSDEPKNLVQLTAEEHFVAHQLLHRLYPNVKGLAFALIAMTGNPYGARCNKAYGWIRRRVAVVAAELSSEMWRDEGYRERHRTAMQKVRDDPEFSKRMAEILSKTHKGRVKSEQERANIAKAGRSRKPRTFSEEARRNMSEARKKTWAERRENGTAGEIGKKTAATRRANGSYSFTEEHKAKIGKAGIGRVPWNKGKRKEQ